MKDLLQYQIYGHMVQEWLLAILWIVGAFVAGRITLWINRHVMQKKASQTATKYDDILVASIRRPMMFAIMLLGIWLGANAMHPAPETAAQISKACCVLLIICVAWFAARLSRGFFAEYAQHSKKSDKTAMNALHRAVIIVIWIVAVVGALQTVGINLGALLATLGIGTAAVALAAQDILKNIIAGITLFIDRPFRIGEYIKTKEVEGYVKRIGLRSTSLETFDKRLVTLPNHKMTDMAIENVSGEPSRRVILKLGLVYQTTPSKMQEAVDLLTSLPKTVQGITSDTCATFSGYGDFALEVRFCYHIKKKYDVLRVESDVNFAILKLFADAGLEFAYPTQTIVMDR